MSDIKDRYMFVSQENEEWASIMIKDGKFKDVIYNYGKVSIPEEDNLNEDGTLPFHFEYNIIDNVGVKTRSNAVQNSLNKLNQKVKQLTK